MRRAGSWSNAKLVLGVLGSLLLLAVVVDVLGRIVPRGDAAPLAAGAGDPTAPPRPVLTREDEFTIRIDTGFMSDSRVRFNGNDSTALVDAMFDCLARGIEQEFGASAAATPDAQRRRTMRATMDQIQHRCTETVVLAPAPAPLEPDGPGPPG